MQFSVLSATLLLTSGLLLAQIPANEAASEAKGMPPRTSAADYQAHAQAGSITIGAEFDEHGVPTPEQALTTEDFVVVEVGLFGPPEARVTLSPRDFSLRLKGKKAPLASEPLELVFQSLKDPEWAPPQQSLDTKSKGGLTGGSGGGGNNNDPPPLPPKMPFELVRAMQLHVRKAALPEGDRPLPQAGLIFFQYRGKGTGIRSVELIYSGPAGNATLPLEP